MTDFEVVDLENSVFRDQGIRREGDYLDVRKANRIYESLRFRVEDAPDWELTWEYPDFVGAGSDSYRDWHRRRLVHKPTGWSVTICDYIVDTCATTDEDDGPKKWYSVDSVAESANSVLEAAFTIGPEQSCADASQLADFDRVRETACRQRRHRCPSM